MWVLMGFCKKPNALDQCKHEHFDFEDEDVLDVFFFCENSLARLMESNLSRVKWAYEIPEP